MRIRPAPQLSILENVRNVEKAFLSAKRRDRAADLDSAIRIFMEILHGFESFTFQTPCVSVFGSARFAPTHHYYKLARSLGRELALNGFSVMTGGGPGIMEAANRGAKEGGGLSLACNIRLPKEQKLNNYVDHFVEFDHFFVRKLMLVKNSCAFVAMPGGYGTLDEVFETLTLIQTGKIEQFPVIVMGSKFWNRFEMFAEKTLLEEETITPTEGALLQEADSVKRAVAMIRQGIPTELQDCLCAPGRVRPPRPSTKRRGKRR